jgi:hypothetical protein
MNPQETAQLTRFIDAMRRDLDLTILLIEHDMRVVMGSPTWWRCSTTASRSPTARRPRCSATRR